MKEARPLPTTLATTMKLYPARTKGPCLLWLPPATLRHQGGCPAPRRSRLRDLGTGNGPATMAPGFCSESCLLLLGTCHLWAASILLLSPLPPAPPLARPPSLPPPSSLAIPLPPSPALPLHWPSPCRFLTLAPPPPWSPPGTAHQQSVRRMPEVPEDPEPHEAAD